MTSRMTVAQYRAAQNKGPSREAKTRKNKYSAEKTVVNGIEFDSKREAERYADLRIMERAGLIEGLQRQVKIYLMCGGVHLYGENNHKLFYLADFRYLDAETGAIVVEDAKGFKTPVYALKKAILRAQGIEVVEV